MNPKTLSLKLGSHRGNPRVWIEGNQLVAFGFNAGVRFSVEFGRGVIFVRLDAEGNREVSGRTRDGKTLPIIEVCCADARNSLSRSVVHAGESALPARVAVMLSPGFITIKPEGAR
jgi:hypothetical protein